MYYYDRAVLLMELMDSRFPGNVAPVMSFGDEKKKGFRKKLVKKGQGWKSPNVGDEVEVHCIARIFDEKEYYDSSRDKGTPFKFILGSGEIIKGWDVGIQGMKKGERAVFAIPPDLGYGESGSAPTVPPNATLDVDTELLSWVSARDICKDGGIFKNILEEGENWENPNDLDEVLVKFQAWLGSVNFTWIGGTSDGVEFTVNEGHFCPALSKAVKTMRKGEKVVLLVKPQYGFGSTGKPASGDYCAVPPDASFFIALVLVSWKTVSVLTDDNKIIKKIMKEGEGYEYYDWPNDGAIVKVKLIGRLQDGTEFVKKGHVDGDELYEFKIGEEQVIEGLDIAAVTMKKSEVALLIIAPEYAFGSSESKQELATVPANSTVYYEIEMVSFVKEKEFGDMNSEEKIAAADKKKEQGDVIFKAGQYAKSSRKYQMATMYIEDDSSFSDKEKQQSRALKVTCYLIDATCKLELKEYKQAETLCTKVLELDSQNVKALYRRAQAYHSLVDYERAESDIRKAQKIEPENRDVQLEYKKLKKEGKGAEEGLAPNKYVF